MLKKLAVVVGTTALLTAGIGVSTQASAADLSCKKSVGRTAGWAECKGSGTFRVKSLCQYEADKHTSWVKVTKGSVRINAKGCTYKITGVEVHKKV